MSDFTTPVDSYFDFLAVERAASNNTLQAYRRDIDRYISFLTCYPVNSLGEVTQNPVSYTHLTLPTICSV